MRPRPRERVLPHIRRALGEIWLEEPWVQLSNWRHWKPAPIYWLLKNRANSVTVGDSECPGVRAGHCRPQAPPSIPGHIDLTGPSHTHKDLVDLSWCIFKMIIYLNLSLCLHNVPSTKNIRISNEHIVWRNNQQQCKSLRNTNVPKFIFLILLV
jgi:hypothetical protein